MKKQNNIRRFISSLLCLVMAVSAFSVFSFAEGSEGDATVCAFVCTVCYSGYGTKWLPIGGDTTYDSHYYTKTVNGVEQTFSCTIKTVTGGECLVCNNPACGAMLGQNEYVKSVTHSSCGL